MAEPRKRGRPRKYASNAERVKAFRDKQKNEGRRIDAYINSKADKRLTRLTKQWNCSIGQVIERLLIEADD